MARVQEKRFKIIPEMEGRQARWYAAQRRSGGQMAAYRARARELAAGLPPGAGVLEVAPGPGYLAAELARLGLSVTAVDVSRTMVEIATEHARGEGVAVDVRQGDVADLALQSSSFDLVVCQAAFKNFTEPVRALDEMHRVLRTGGTAVIEDLSAEASAGDIAAEVAGMRLSAPNALLTRVALRFLRRRAYRAERFLALAAESRFGAAEIATHGVGVVVTLRR